MQGTENGQNGPATPDVLAACLPERCRIFVAIWQIVMLLGFFLFVEYDSSLFDGTASEENMKVYGHFQDIHVMIFVGFGFLMTFLRKYGYSAVSLNMLVAGFCIQWYILIGGLMGKLVINDSAHSFDQKIQLNLMSFITGDFAAAVVLITFGGLIGKVTFPQILLISFFEIIFFAFNETLNIKTFKISDMGGSVVVHTFGAYFGLAASMVLTTEPAKTHVDNAADKTSDLFSMVGTLFLWMYWPSFNSAPAGPVEQQRCVINTLTSITGSLCTAFIASHFFRGGKFNMVDVQNATLAGGVAIGTACSMAISPGGALLVGTSAGVLSVFGFTTLSPMLERSLGLYDTCGIHNLHGMPGVMAGIVGAIVAASATEGDYKGLVNLKIAFPGRYNDAGDEVRSAGQQAGMQMLFLAVTLGIAIFTGALTGYVVKALTAPPVKYFNDEEDFDVEEEEIPAWAQMASPSSHLVRRKPLKLDENGNHVPMMDMSGTDQQLLVDLSKSQTAPGGRVNLDIEMAQNPSHGHASVTTPQFIGSLGDPSMNMDANSGRACDSRMCSGRTSFFSSEVGSDAAYLPGEEPVNI